MYRFFENIKLQTGKIIQLNNLNSYKIINVLKLKINQEIYLFNNTNHVFLSKINKITNKLVFIEIISDVISDLESPLKIHLAQAIAKYDNMDLVIQKTTELGVNEITPIISARTIVKPHNFLSKNNHWQQIAIAACAQCGRNIIPNINPIVSFKDFIKSSSTTTILPSLTTTPPAATTMLPSLTTTPPAATTMLKLILSPPDLGKLSFAPNSQILINNFEQLLTLYLSQAYATHDQAKLTSDLNNEHQKAYEVVILIGPEGGFTAEELIMANNNAFNTITLGPRILRTETTSMVIISLLQAKLGDF